jgi:SOS-response transcriptional repressor LexA
VVVSRKKEMKNGDVCLVMFEDGDACLRRVYCHDHTVTLTSANEKDYPPAMHKKSEIRFIYRMVQKITNY